MWPHIVTLVDNPVISNANTHVRTDCSWMKSLRGGLVGEQQCSGRYIVLVILGKRETWALVDMVCEQALVQQEP